MSRLKTHPLRSVRLHLIRHGEVEDRWQRVFAGSRVDMGLSPVGHAQALSLADWFGERKVDAVFSSPMLRVRQTMAPLLARQSLTPVFLEGLREVDFGDFTGLRWEQVRERLGVTAVNWLHVLDHPGLPNGESAADLLARVRPCVDQILATSGSPAPPFFATAASSAPSLPFSCSFHLQSSATCAWTTAALPLLTSRRRIPPQPRSVC